MQQYVEFRKLHGEKITGESWLLRDKFLTTTDRHAANKSLPTHPQKLEVEAIKKLIQRAWEVQGVREPLKENEHRHEFKSSHGLRKYFKTKTVAAGMDPHNVELLMDHKTELADNYYRPTEQELQDDYVNRALDYLTVNTERKAASQLQKQVTELKEEREQNNYTIMGRLAEKDKQIEELQKQQQKMVEMFKTQMPVIVRNTLEKAFSTTRDDPRIKELMQRGNRVVHWREDSEENL